MTRVVLVVLLSLIAGCGIREGTEPVGEPNSLATITSVSRPPSELVRWMDRICGVTGWLADTSAAGRALAEAAEVSDVDEFLTTAVVYVDTRLAQLTSLPETYTDGDTLARNLRTALEEARPRIVTLATGVGSASSADKLNRVAEVVALLDEARAVSPSITDLVATNPELDTAHQLARDCD